MTFRVQPRIFVSHRHDYDDDYHNLKSRIESWGIATHDSTWYAGRRTARMSQRELEQGLRASIAWCNVFVVVARMASVRGAGWCEWEVALADELGKPILAYIPRGMTRTPAFIQAAANHCGSFSRADRFEACVTQILRRPY